MSRQDAKDTWVRFVDRVRIVIGRFGVALLAVNDRVFPTHTRTWRIVYRAAERISEVDR